MIKTIKAPVWKKLPTPKEKSDKDAKKSEPMEWDNRPEFTFTESQISNFDKLELKKTIKMEIEVEVVSLSVNDSDYGNGKKGEKQARMKLIALKE
jgi:hypothetical protein